MTDDLRATFARLIAATGPISIAQFMGESNARYYNGKDPLGGAGDFITAPEISQMFGELIGLWLTDVWIRAGRPANARYVEMGPGRGTLARDALRAAGRYGFAPQVHLVEASEALRAVQAENLPEALWHADMSTLPLDGPLLIVANEFLDALPVRQLVRTAKGWRERMVGLDGSDETARLIPVVGDRPMDAAVPPVFADAPEGAIVETSPAAAAVMYETCGRLMAQGGTALFIDYGHASPALGSSLQAVRDHRKVDPFAMPGAADLTAHVDFSALSAIAGAKGARWLGTVEQGAFLRALGIEARADALAGFAPQHADAIHSARERLTGEGQMGALFKVMGLAAPDWPAGAGF
ncbi:MAG: hypothetical protein RIS94_446 [Pseudomonadota bacterium]|jgi:NADH dehydrogenase [ubiquinone] 1 alpha subcomplex assembly factor 7